MRTLTRAAALTAALLVPLAGGCAGKKDEVAEGRTKPKGRILDNGLPLKPKMQSNMPPGDPGMKVVFVRLGGSDAGQEIQAVIHEPSEATFELIGVDGKGITPGKYRVAVTLGPEGGQDQLKGKYTRENSKIEVEVKEGEDLVIDIAKYK